MMDPCPTGCTNTCCCLRCILQDCLYRYVRYLILSCKTHPPTFKTCLAGRLTAYRLRRVLQVPASVTSMVEQSCKVSLAVLCHFLHSLLISQCNYVHFRALKLTVTRYSGITRAALSLLISTHSASLTRTECALATQTSPATSCWRAPRFDCPRPIKT